jgi:hypothetical protein
LPVWAGYAVKPVVMILEYQAVSNFGTIFGQILGTFPKILDIFLVIVKPILDHKRQFK